MKPCCEVAGMFQVTCLDCNPVRREPRQRVQTQTQRKPAGPPRAKKNLCAKTVKRENAYEVWQAGDWTWYVLKKWQADDDKPGARWFCEVVTPMTYPGSDIGDVYVAEIKKNARRVK